MHDPVHLIDIGARSGIPSRWQRFHDRLDVLAFEPDPEECARLEQREFPYQVRFLPVALGANDGEQATLRICSQPGMSSLLPLNTDLLGGFDYGADLRVVGEYPLTLRRLDAVCGDYRPDVIKVDTEGTELDILKGAGHLLDDVLAVELEVSFVPMRVGQPLFADVDAFMREQGFMLRGIRRVCWRNRARQTHCYGAQLMHGDALYLRPERLDCPKGHIILAAYLQYDLLASFGATHLIPGKRLPFRLLSALASRLPGDFLRRFADAVRPDDATDWHDVRFF